MRTTLNCQGTILDLSKPVVMGIINLTPDSFYEGSRKKSVEEALKQLDLMIEEGAGIIDFGATSTRPGAKEVSESEELQRLMPKLEAAISRFPETIFSVDTFRARIAKEAISLGAGIINDISGGEFDPELIKTLAYQNVCYILMHNKGKPGIMQSLAVYEDVILDLLNYFSLKIADLGNHGVKDIILDPGFGFAKSISQNFSILKNLHCFNIFDHPLMVGISRKSMIYRSLNISPDQALNGTTALHMKALLEGAKILRVHDVKEAVETIRLFELLRE